MSFQYTRHLDDHHIWTWISMAFEGGSNYWIKWVEVPQEVCDLYKPSNTLFEDLLACQDANAYNWIHQIPFLEDGELIVETYEGTKYTLCRSGIEDGIALMAINSPRHFNDMVDEGGDSDTADVLLQYSLLGEVRYG